MRPIRHVIWDWNGTLFDDAWLCVEVMNELLAAREMPALTPARYADIFDFPVIRYYERLGFDFSSEPFEEVGLEFIRRYQSRRLEPELRRDAREVLSALSEQGIGHSVLSAYQHEALIELLERLSIADDFLHILGIDDHYAAGKTSQGRDLLRRLDVPREEILLVGDTLHDAEVARALGVHCCLIPSGNQSSDRLRSAGVPLLGGLHDLLRYGGRLPREVPE